jgi:microcystin-dependent protein
MMASQTDIVGTISFWASKQIPTSWMACNGGYVSKTMYPDLYKKLKSTYGQETETTFALPDMRGRTPLGPGKAPSGETYQLGSTGGTERIQLTQNHLPRHNHYDGAIAQFLPMNASTGGKGEDSYSPKDCYCKDTVDGVKIYGDTLSSDQIMYSDTITPSPTSSSTGGADAISIVQASLCVAYIIKVQ